MEDLHLIQLSSFHPFTLIAFLNFVGDEFFFLNCVPMILLIIAHIKYILMSKMVMSCFVYIYAHIVHVSVGIHWVEKHFNSYLGAYLTPLWCFFYCYIQGMCYISLITIHVAHMEPFNGLPIDTQVHGEVCSTIMWSTYMDCLILLWWTWFGLSLLIDLWKVCPMSWIPLLALGYFTCCQASIGHEGLLWLQHVVYRHAIDFSHKFPRCCMRKFYTNQTICSSSSSPIHAWGRT